MNTYVIETERGPITVHGDEFTPYNEELTGETYGFAVKSDGKLVAAVGHRSFVSVTVTQN